LFTEAEAQFSKMKMTEAAGFAKTAGDAAGATAKEAKTGNSPMRKRLRPRSVSARLATRISRERWRWWFQAEDAVVQEYPNGSQSEKGRVVAPFYFCVNP
jgi:hypothetical protein